MTKNFCDICDTPACKPVHTMREIGELHNLYTCGGGERTTRTKILTTVNFCFQDHPKGYGGPPDLCKKCAVSLLAQMIAELEKQ